MYGCVDSACWVVLWHTSSSPVRPAVAEKEWKMQFSPPQFGWKSDIFVSATISIEIDNTTTTSGRSLKDTLSYAHMHFGCGPCSSLFKIASHSSWSVSLIPPVHIDTDQSTHHWYALITLTHTQLEASPLLSLFSRSSETVLPKVCHFWHLSHSLSTTSNSLELKFLMNDTLAALFNTQK